jgi:uncharacterized protein (TIGR02996 family)
MTRGPAAHPEGRKFLRAIAAEPDDDTVRLIFCDWLEENDFGEDAVFVRRHLDLSKMSRGRSEEALDLREWCNVWITTNFRRWLYPLVETFGPDEFSGFVRRGFLECVEVTPRRFVRNAALLFATQPVTEVALRPKRQGFVRDRYLEQFFDADLIASAPDAARVPGPIFPYLAELGLPCEVRGATATFARAVSAQGIISAVAVAFGRDAAGLPALPRPDPARLWMPTRHR